MSNEKTRAALMAQPSKEPMAIVAAFAKADAALSKAQEVIGKDATS